MLKVSCSFVDNSSVNSGILMARSFHSRIKKYCTRMIKFIAVFSHILAHSLWNILSKQMDSGEVD